jgi:threonine/homoserine/homoserine lactone efflux protein
MFSFLLMTVGVSLSGVMAPGPVTTATLAAGTRNRHAGLLIAVGHGIVEFPLMWLIIAGMGVLFKRKGVHVGIGLIGGAFMIHMGTQMLIGLRKPQPAKADEPIDRNPVWIGVVLTAGNAYFLIWWATAGLALSTQALQYGRIVFAVFAVLHWLCDAVWLEILSYASFKGTQVLGPRSQRIVLSICSAALIAIGALFVFDAGKTLFKHGLPAQTTQPVTTSRAV